MNSNVVTRFAPSPTGFLHIGGARTALFNYLFAKHYGGKFLLRIEDTDKARSTAEATAAIFNSLKWLDINWEGTAVFQSSRAERHLEVARELLKRKKAYLCFTTQAEIDAKREAAKANRQHFIFQSPWRDANPSNHPNGINPVIRLKAPHTGNTVVCDRLQGDIIIENSHIDDLILVRSDGSPTYMLAVVVDDHDMAITHIIRGDDHLTNAARQIAIYQACEWQVPEMVHIPLIHGPDGTKLSKRHGALGIEHYQVMGYLPDALCNYLLRLGWAHGNDEIINRDLAIQWFDISGLGKSPARLDFAKMKYLNAHYLRNVDDNILTNTVVERLNSESTVVNYREQQAIKQAMPALKVRAELITDLVEMAKIYLTSRPLQYSTEALNNIQCCNRDYIHQVITKLRIPQVFDKDVIQLAIKEVAEDNNIKLGDLMKPIRALITGASASPSVFEIMAIIGKDYTIERLQQVDQYATDLRE